MLNKSLKGATLIDLLIGVAVGSFLVAGLLLLYVNLAKSNNSLLSAARLEHELQTAINLMAEDIRRAGYNAKMLDLIAKGKANPFMISGQSDIQIPNSQCILFSYDYNQSGILPPLNTANHDNRFGFRLKNHAIQSRASSDPFFECAKGQWWDLTNNKLIIVNDLIIKQTTNQFAIDGSNPPPQGSSLSTRLISISISGHLAKAPLISQTITRQVKVRNDKLMV